MTQKHFEAIAQSIAAEAEVARQLNDTARLAGVESLALRFMRQFNAMNPRFDRDRFLTACGF